MPTSFSRPLLLFRRVCWVGVVLWAAIVFILSSIPGPEVAELNVFDVWDKALHFAAFFCGAFPLVPALRLGRDWSWRRVVAVAAAALSLYGAFDEVHQLITPSRSALDAGDWIADTLGAIAGAALTAFIHARFERTHRPAPTRD
jgi:VanZ family protein